MVKRMEAMAETVTVLIQAVAQISKNNQASGMMPNNGPHSQNTNNSKLPDKEVVVDQGKVLRENILALISTNNYENAFTQALSASDPSVAVFACQNSNIKTVLDNDTPQLSQPILLCLMQQLGTHLLKNSNGSGNTNSLEVELAWLQIIAITLDLEDESITAHGASVCQGLIENINTKMKQGNTSLRRPLQTLLLKIRGMLVMFNDR